MTSSNTSRHLLERLHRCESEAATEIFDRYVVRLVSMTRHRMSAKLQRRVDAEDVVQSAMRSFFVRAAGEQYVLQRSGDLWRLLAAITLSKLRRQVEVHTAAKRAVAKEQPAMSALDWTNLAHHSPTPDEQVALLEELRQVMEACSLAERQALEMRLAGDTIEDISQAMNRSQRTVRRLMQSVQHRLEQRLSHDVNP